MLNRGGNVVLLHFLLGLRTATEDEMVADLLVNILKVCPDLLNRYFKETHYSFVPRVSPAWMDNVKLLKRVRVWMMVKNHAQSRRLCRHLNWTEKEGVGVRNSGKHHVSDMFFLRRSNVKARLKKPFVLCECSAASLFSLKWASRSCNRLKRNAGCIQRVRWVE